jgi:L-seryl-tRNA(Ser) seleniumtransferase
MSAYESLGVRPIINATCHWTVYGGSVMWPEVIQAMAKARESCVDMRRLLDSASEVISRYTHAEASYVVSGCAAALQAGVAALLTGDDPVAMAMLPDTADLPKRQFLARRDVRRKTADGREYPYRSYAQAVMGAGGTFVEVGGQDSEANGVTRAELEAAFTPETAGVYWQCDGLEPGVQLDEVVEVAHGHGVPVLVDASNVLPPPENLYAFVEIGADLVAFSGGKGLRGPQGSGILTGRADLIHAAREQCAPEHGVGRPLKVSKEEIVGLVTALETWAGQDHAAALEAAQRRTAYVVEALAGLPGVRAEHKFPDHRGRLYPTVFMHLDPAAGLTGAEVIAQMLAGDPSVAIMSFDDPQIVRADVRILTDAETEIVANRLRAVLSRSMLGQGVPAV